METVLSKQGCPVRLTSERWNHIKEEHGELVSFKQEVLETVANPDTILDGKHGEKLALRNLETKRWIVVAYKEMESDGFIITAFITTRLGFIKRRKQLWP